MCPEMLADTTFEFGPATVRMEQMKLQDTIWVSVYFAFHWHKKLGPFSRNLRSDIAVGVTKSQVQGPAEKPDDL